MAGGTDSRPPLPDWVLECNDCLRQYLCSQLEAADTKPQGIERTAAIELLLTTTDVVLETEDAEYAITRLLNRGYLYQVETELRLTEPGKQCSS